MKLEYFNEFYYMNKIRLENPYGNKRVSLVLSI